MNEEIKTGAEMTDEEIFDKLSEAGLLGLNIEYKKNEEEKTIVRYCQDCLNTLGFDWKIRTSSGYGHFAACNYEKKSIILCEISFLEAKIMERMHFFRDTVIHELCHACRPLASHKEPWKKLMRKLGLRDSIDSPLPIKVREAIPYKYILIEKSSGLTLRGWCRNSKSVKQYMEANGEESKTLCIENDGRKISFK